MADQILTVLDSTGTTQNMSVTKDAEGSFVGSTCVADPTTGVKGQVGDFHAVDAQSLSTGSQLVAAVELVANGSNTLDRKRGNVDAQASLVSLVSQTAATLQSSDQINFNGRGVQLGINVTSIGAATTLTITILGKDVASGQYYTLLVSVAISVAGFTQLTVYPGITATSNVAAAQVLPRTWAVKAVVAGSNSVSATIGASVIV